MTLTQCWVDVGQRLQRCTNIHPTSGERIVFAGDDPGRLMTIWSKPGVILAVHVEVSGQSRDVCQQRQVMTPSGNTLLSHTKQTWSPFIHRTAEFSVLFHDNFFFWSIKNKFCLQYQRWKMLGNLRDHKSWKKHDCRPISLHIIL